MSLRPCVGGHKNCEESIVNTEQSIHAKFFPRQKFISRVAGENRQKHCFIIQFFKPPAQDRWDKNGCSMKPAFYTSTFFVRPKK